MKLSIVTPSFRSSSWLKLCIASVADQGVDVEHIVQDAESDDGTQDWLPNDKRVKAFIEKDAGMYDAVNRGWKRANGDILAYLNCDEQYLPGALKIVLNFFETHPETEVLFAGSIVTDAEGGYICHRHSLVPNPYGIWYRFPVLTSSLFIRRKVVHERGILFDTRWRVVGDFHWVCDLIKNQVPMVSCDDFTSVFTDTGDNLCLQPRFVTEKADSLALMPAWLKMSKYFWIAHHQLRRWTAGQFSVKPMSCALYTRSSPERRVTINVGKPTVLWHTRKKAA